MFAFASCSKSGTQGDGIDESGNFQIYFKSDLGTQLLDNTRAIATPVPDGYPVNFDQGWIVFTTGPDLTDKITRVVEITTTGANGSVSRQNLEDGVFISGVPATSNRIMLFANLDNTMFNTMGGLEGQNVSELEKPVFDTDIKNHSNIDPTKGLYVDDATLFGKGTIDKSTLSTLKYAKASLTVSPLISRIEVGEIKIDTDGDQTTTFGISEATLQTILINNYVDKMYVDGIISGSLVNNGQAFDLYDPTHGSFAYTGMSPYLYDELVASAGNMKYTVGTPADAAINAGTGKSWAFNTFASGVPHVILKLTGVKVFSAANHSNPVDYQNTTTTQPNGDCWVTVRGFLLEGTQTEIAAFEGGKVYRVKSLIIGSDNLHDVPEPEEEEYISVWVEVEVLDWSVVYTDPILS